VQPRPHLRPLELQPPALNRRDGALAVRIADANDVDWHARRAGVGEPGSPFVVVRRVVAVGDEQNVLGTAVARVKGGDRRS
jgi:hypothetical protein